MSERGSRQLDSQNHVLTLATTDGGDAIPIDVQFAMRPQNDRKAKNEDSIFNRISSALSRFKFRVTR
ncbi:MAG: hypothetical protein ABSG31_19115, partial [Tepidisphaeraceae bacterium]